MIAKGGTHVICFRGTPFTSQQFNKCVRGTPHGTHGGTEMVPMHYPLLTEGELCLWLIMKKSSHISRIPPLFLLALEPEDIFVGRSDHAVIK